MFFSCSFGHCCRCVVFSLNLCSRCPFLEDAVLVLEALFFKFSVLVWVLVCAVSQSTYFAASYTGVLEHMLAGINLSQESASYYRKKVAIYTSIAWIGLLMMLAFLFYTLFFTNGYMDIMLAPVTIHVNVSNLMVTRAVVFVVAIYCHAAWLFSLVMNLVLATIFSHQYKQLDHAFKRLAVYDEPQIRDSEIENLRQRHQDISNSVADADNFLKFSNAGSFCGHLLGTIALLYIKLFYYSCMTDPVIVVMHALWIIGQSFGLSLTAAAGIMVNHYVSTKIISLV